MKKCLVTIGLICSFVWTTIPVHAQFEEYRQLMSEIENLNNRAEKLRKQGKYSAAEPLYLQALELLAEKDSVVQRIYGADIYNNIGGMYVGAGDFEQAESFLDKALKMRKEIYGEKSRKYAETLNNLGMLYLYCRDYQSARRYEEAANAIYGDRDSTETRIVLLNNLGLINRHIGTPEDAQKYYFQAYEMSINTLGFESEQTGSILNNLGELYRENELYEDADTCYTLALEVREAVFGPNSPACAQVYHNKGGMYAELGDMERSLECVMKAYAIRENTLGEKHYLTLKSKDAIAALRYGFHQYDEAERLSSECSKIHKEHFIQTTLFLSERQRESFRGTIQFLYEVLYPIVSYKDYPLNHEAAAFAYNNELFYNGLLLTSSDAIRRSIYESGDSSLVRQWNRLAYQRQQIMMLEEKDDQSVNPEQLREQAEAQEKELIRSSAVYRQNIRQWNITWDSVRAVLKPKQVAIEFMRAPLNEDSTMYCALLLRHDSDYPELIPLFEEKQVTKLLHTSTYEPAKINKTYTYEGNGKKLSDLIWNPIKSYIQEGDQIFISPTHMLHQIAIENLPYDSARTMSDVYQIARLSSTRELVLPKKQIPHQQATLYGGILYDTLTTSMIEYNKVLYAKRGGAADNSSQRVYRIAPFNPLYDTQDEVDAITPILEKQHIAVTIYSDFSACEESVKALSGKKQNILHFATHGMYMDTLTTNDPLERCLLAFAGVNRALRGESVDEGMDDGILTAKEISVLDFRDADIVVMSACETGLGDISGEGVFGLQRAFKMAGAQTILMALWQVNDKATRILMTAFYRNYSKGTMSKREAFRMAQQEVRDYTETKTVPIEIMPAQEEKMKSMGKDLEPRIEYKTVTIQPYESPYYWAGFILLD